MLYFSRWTTAAILAVTLIICLAALPNVLPEHVLANLPSWAQHKIRLAAHLQGGTRVVLAVDADYVRREKLEQLRVDVRRMLRQAQIAHDRLIAHRDRVEVQISDGEDVDRALSKLRELTWPLYGLASANTVTHQRTFYPFGTSADAPRLSAGRNSRLPEPEVVIDSAGRVIWLKLTEAAIIERVRQARDASFDLVTRRVNQLGTYASVQPQGFDRVMIEIPGLYDIHRMKEY
jgi:preprotein translocase subunit SecD